MANSFQDYLICLIIFLIILAAITNILHLVILRQHVRVLLRFRNSIEYTKEQTVSIKTLL